MKAIYFTQYGESEVLQYSDSFPTPVPAEGECLIKIKAAGINPVDSKVRKGLLADRMPCYFPIIPGWDFAGEIVSRGHAAKRFEVGDAVWGYARRQQIQHGTYAEYICLPEAYLDFKPKNISFEQAAAVPLAGLTAWQCLMDKANLRPGQSVLIIGASGGVGGFAIQYAKAVGLNIAGVASVRNHEYAKELGATSMFDYKSDWSKEAREFAPEGFDAVMDFYGKESARGAYDCVKQNSGVLVSILNKIPDTELLSKLGIRYEYVFVEPNSSQLAAIRNLIVLDKVKVDVSQVYTLEAAAAAQQQSELMHTRGKIVLRID